MAEFETKKQKKNMNEYFHHAEKPRSKEAASPFACVVMTTPSKTQSNYLAAEHAKNQRLRDRANGVQEMLASLYACVFQTLIRTATNVTT